MTKHFDPSKDYYSVLGLDESADVEVIKTIYRVLAKRYHPDVCAGDKTKAEEIFKALNEAYGILVDASVRSAYDAARKKQQGGTEDFSNSGYSYAADDENDFSDEKLDEAWKIAVSIYPEIEVHRQNISKLSGKLGLAFVSVLINTKTFGKALSLKEQIENNFLEKYFGSDQKIRWLGRDLILTRMKDVARALNKAIKVIGSPVNTDEFLLRFLKQHDIAAGHYLSCGEIISPAALREIQAQLEDLNLRAIFFFVLSVCALFAILFFIVLLGV